jgi:hypothetical protein
MRQRQPTTVLNRRDTRNISAGGRLFNGMTTERGACFPLRLLVVPSAIWDIASSDPAAGTIDGLDIGRCLLGVLGDAV